MKSIRFLLILSSLLSVELSGAYTHPDLIRYAAAVPLLIGMPSSMSLKAVINHYSCPRDKAGMRLSKKRSSYCETAAACIDYIGKPMAASGLLAYGLAVYGPQADSVRPFLSATRAVGWAFRVWGYKTMSHWIHTYTFDKLVTNGWNVALSKNDPCTINERTVRAALTVAGYGGAACAVAMGRPKLAYWLAMYPYCTL